MDNGDPDHLLRHADQAMYIAKQKGKNCYHTFDIQKDVAIKNFNEKITCITQGLKNNELVLYYQPKIDLRNKRVTGAEALIQWRHPQRGILGPAEFLLEVERDILGVEIGKWVIQSALKQLNEWQAVHSDMSISVNISPLHLPHESFVSELERYLSIYPNFRPSSLEFEIVESSALKDVQSVSKIITVATDLALICSIDDFGVSYSSLVYPKQLSVKYCCYFAQGFGIAKPMPDENCSHGRQTGRIILRCKIDRPIK